MIFQSNDGSIAVSISDNPDSNNSLIVSVDQLVPGNIWALIKIDFGGPDNSWTLNYKTQDLPQTWAVKGSHPGEHVVDAKITITDKF